MYEELVKGLRGHAERFNYDGWIDTAIWFEKAADAIEQLQAIVPRWIPVTERLPENTRDVLVALKSRYGRCIYINFAAYENGVWYEPNGHEPFIDATKRVTHWVTLPEPPKGETE